MMDPIGADYMIRPQIAKDFTHMDHGYRQLGMNNIIVIIITIKSCYSMVITYSDNQKGHPVTGSKFQRKHQPLDVPILKHYHKIELYD